MKVFSIKYQQRTTILLFIVHLLVPFCLSFWLSFVCILDGYWLSFTFHLLVADVFEALPHPLHLVAQLVLLLQSVHPLFQVNLRVWSKLRWKVDCFWDFFFLGGGYTFWQLFTCSLSLLSVRSLSTVADNLALFFLNFFIFKKTNWHHFF